MVGGHGVGGACSHIKEFGLIPFPRQREFGTEGLLGRHALGMLGRTLVMIVVLCVCLCVCYHAGGHWPHALKTVCLGDMASFVFHDGRRVGFFFTKHIVA